MFRARTAILLLSFATTLRAGENRPDKSWSRIDKPESAGYARAGVDHALAVRRGLKTSSMIVLVGGRVLPDYGDTAERDLNFTGLGGKTGRNIRLLMLRDGRWRERQVVPKTCVKSSTRSRSVHLVNPSW